MKTTIDLPDDLYRRVKAKSALEGRTVREVATSLFQQWADGTVPRPQAPPAATHGDGVAQQSDAWLKRWLLLSSAFEAKGAAEGSLEQLAEDRRRLDG